MSDSVNIQEQFPEALERLDGDVELLCEMAAVTANDLPKLVLAVEDSTKGDDVDEMTKSLHKLKGVLSTFDSGGLVLSLQELLETARRGKTDDLATEFASQRSEIDTLCHRIQALAKQASSQ